MSLRSLSSSALLALALFSGIANADRLLVAGPVGMVFQADTETGQFHYFACACGGPVLAMAADKERLYTADSLGQILVFDVETGDLEAIHAPPFAPMTALATGEGFLFAGNQDGLIVRIDPDTGNALDSRAMPAGVNALVGHRGYLYAAGSDGAVYRAQMSGGAFTYFTCFCFFDIKGMAAQGELLYVVDSFGITGHIDLANGNIIFSSWVGSTNAMVLEGGDFLLHPGGGLIERRDVDTGQLLPGGYSSPIDVTAMLVLRDDLPPSPLQARVPRGK